MEVGDGFLQLQDNHHYPGSRRSSFFPQHSIETSASPNSSAYVTRLFCNCGCKACSLKVERDEEKNLRLGGVTLAPTAQLAFFVFGIFLLLAGIVLTGLAYAPQPPEDDTPQDKIKSLELKEEKIAGPLCIAAGLLLTLCGLGLALLRCTLEAEAKRRKSVLSRFSFDSRGGGMGLGDTSTYFDETSGSLHPARKPSFFRSSFSSQVSNQGQGSTRRSSLVTIAQTVPVGIFLPNGNSSSPTNKEVHHRTPPRLSFNLPTPQEGGRGELDEDFILPALPVRHSSVPIFMSPNPLMTQVAEPGLSILSSRSDEPFGSISSLGSGSGTHASFPEKRGSVTSTASMRIEECDETTSTHCEGLPSVRVTEMGNVLTVSEPKMGRPHLRSTKSEEYEDQLSPGEVKRPSSTS